MVRCIIALLDWTRSVDCIKSHDQQQEAPRVAPPVHEEEGRVRRDATLQSRRRCYPD